MLCPIGKNALQRLKLSSQEFLSHGLWQQLLHPSRSLESPRDIRLDHSLGSALGRTGDIPGYSSVQSMLGIPGGREHSGSFLFERR